MTKARICRNTLRRGAAGWITAVSGASVLFGGICLAVAPLSPANAKAEAAMSTTTVRQTENEAGDAVADAVRTEVSTDIGLVPAAAFKPSATAPRPATGDQIAALLDPATDQIVVLNLRGAQVLAALERSVSFAPQPSAGYLQISGIRFSYDLRRDSGKRVVSATIDGKPLEAARIYKVATTRPLANGQQGYFQIWDKDQIAQASGTPKTLAEALTDLAKTRGGTLSPMLDGRITAVGQ